MSHSPARVADDVLGDFLARMWHDRPGKVVEDNDAFGLFRQEQMVLPGAVRYGVNLAVAPVTW